MSRSTHTKRVLVLGMSGLDPRRIRAMIRENQLPAFARLQQRGHLGELATSNPASSAVAWSSLATGCNPGKHGIFDAVQCDSATRQPCLSMSGEQPTSALLRGRSHVVSPRKRPGFWRLTSDAGVPTSVIRWPVTFPAEPVHGRFLAGQGVPDVTGTPGRQTLYTTAPVPVDEDRVVNVRWTNAKIRTVLEGPGAPKPTRARMTIVRSDDTGGVVVRIGNEHHAVRLGRWSPWFRVRFRWGPVSRHTALVKFYLADIDPELRLFATPLQIDPVDQAWPITQPAEYGRELLDSLGPFYTLGEPLDTHSVLDRGYDLDGFLDQYREVSRQRQRMFEHELGRFHDGVLAFVFDTGDRIQHLFGAIDDVESPAYEPSRARTYAHVVPDLYRDMDSLLGTALEVVDDRTAVFVVSDHGFVPFRREVHVNRWLIDNGYMTVNHRGRSDSRWHDVDWEQTRAYAVGFSSLYLNLAGREPRGTVQPGHDAYALARQIATGLSRLRDPKSGRSMIRRVYDASTLFTGSHTLDGPNLVVGFEPGFRASRATACGSAPRELVTDNDSLWAADHHVDPSAVPGVVATNLEIECANPQGFDLAPTILNCLDLPVPDYMDGAPWVGDAPSSRPRETAHEKHTPELVAIGAG